MKQGSDDDVNQHKKKSTEDLNLYKLCVVFHLNGLLMNVETQRLNKPNKAMNKMKYLTPP